MLPERCSRRTNYPSRRTTSIPGVQGVLSMALLCFDSMLVKLTSEDSLLRVRITKTFSSAYTFFFEACEKKSQCI